MLRLLKLQSEIYVDEFTKYRRKFLLQESVHITKFSLPMEYIYILIIQNTLYLNHSFYGVIQVKEEHRVAEKSTTV